MHVTSCSLSKRLAGFTILELLAVLAIIVMLNTFVFPVLGSMKSRADILRCVANLREIFSAITLFTKDNNGDYPRASTGVWQVEGGFCFNSIGPYLGEGRVFEQALVSTEPWPQKIPFACPACKNHGWGGAGIDVGINGYPLQSSPVSVPRVRVGAIPNSSTTLLVADSKGWQLGWGMGGSARGFPMPTSIDCRHNGSANVLHFDGHVGQVTQEQLKDPAFVKKLGGVTN